MTDAGAVADDILRNRDLGVDETIGFPRLHFVHHLIEHRLKTGVGRPIHRDASSEPSASEVEHVFDQARHPQRTAIDDPGDVDDLLGIRHHQKGAGSHLYRRQKPGASNRVRQSNPHHALSDFITLCKKRVPAVPANVLIADARYVLGTL